MAKKVIILFLAILFWPSFVVAEETAVAETHGDWLGVWPVFTYSGFISPNYPYYLYSPYYSAYSYIPPGYGIRPAYADTYRYSPLSYVPPYYYYSPYFPWNYPTNAWWIGTHGDLPKTLDIARSGSSMRVYYKGLWQPP